MTEQKKKEEIERCKETWQGTLFHYGIRRTLSHWEELQIARAIKKFGGEMVELALFGARFEKKTEQFDPRDYVSLARVLERDKNGRERIDMYANAGSQKRRALKESRAADPQSSEEQYVTDPARVRELLGKAFSGSGSNSEELSEQEIERRKQDQLRRLREVEGK